MNWIEMLFLAIGLSMDAFAVAVCIGLSTSKSRIQKALIVGLYFGLFQGIMPLIGYIAASQFAERITAFSHWIAFALLVFLGVKMIIGSLKNEKCPNKICPVVPCSDCLAVVKEASLAPRQMIPLAVATSIDALAVGVSLAFLYVSIVPTISFIGVITFAMSAAGVGVGSIFGTKFKSKAIFIGGAMLVLLGIWILVEGLL